jgi:hypothetical protein
MRLNSFWLGSVGHALLTLRRHAEALSALRETVGLAPRYWPGLGWLAAPKAHLGLSEDARDSVAAIRVIEPTITLTKWDRMISYKNQSDRTHVLGGLRMAGMEAWLACSARVPRLCRAAMAQKRPAPSSLNPTAPAHRPRPWRQIPSPAHRPSVRGQWTLPPGTAPPASTAGCCAGSGRVRR